VQRLQRIWQVDHTHKWVIRQGDGLINKNDFGGRLSKILEPSGVVAHVAYANYGAVASVGLSHAPNESGPDDYLVFRTFDQYGRLATARDRNGITITNGYDLLGRLTNRVTLDIGGQPQSTNRFAYTARGMTNATDELGFKTWFVYDTAGRLLSQTNANTEVLQFTYNPADQILTLKDGKNHTTTLGS